MTEKHSKDGRAWIGTDCLLSSPMQEQGFSKENLGLNYHEYSYFLCYRVIFLMYNRIASPEFIS